jgi:ABC-type transport system substrate-binding protein
VPTLHLLIPNYRRPHMTRRTFRRAIVYGIDRQLILERDILGGESIAGSRVISGPFAAGVSANDPLGYAYDSRIAPRPYQPLQAYTLAKVAQNELAVMANKEGREPPVPAKLILAHPADETLRIASQNIAQQLTAVGIECSPRELPPGTSAMDDDDWDLLFVEVTIAEPFVDAYRLLSRDGTVGETSAYLGLALRQLDEAGNWKEVRDALLEIHRIAHEEVTAVPLWQIVDHFAYRRPMQGISDRPVTLYQDVEQWRKTPRLAAHEKQ